MGIDYAKATKIDINLTGTAAREFSGYLEDENFVSGRPKDAENYLGREFIPKAVWENVKEFKERKYDDDAV